ncbi:MAG: lytic murein transglycosylase [Rubrobacteraceae bacterium]
MSYGRAKVVGLLAAAASVVMSVGAAEAQGAGVPEIRAQQADLQAQVREQNVLIDDGMDDLSAVGAELEDTQSRVYGAQARARELQSQTQGLNRDLVVHRETFEASKASYEDQARAAYKGNDLEGLAALVGDFLGGGEGSGFSADFRMAEILLDGRENFEAYQDNRQTLKNTIRQLDQKKGAYNELSKEEKAQAEKLRRQEERLDAAVARMRSDRNQAEARIEQLEAQEREMIRKQRAATGGGDDMQQTELQIAQGGIYASPVDRVSKEKYRKLYKRAAKEYGFARDWYILAAVGKVESDHGENMGPSTAGALGPMQFLPSTWEGSGVDGNGDGKANIMDPRDAIPAAAGYLKVGGAPDDWYAALFSYNHADWYVMEVLAVAEGYRQRAKDDRVGPYI